MKLCPPTEKKYLQLISTDCLINSNCNSFFRTSEQGTIFCVLWNVNYFSLVMSLGGQNGRRLCGRWHVFKLLKLSGVYICNKTRLTWRIKLRIPVVYKSMRLRRQAAVSVYVRQLKERELLEFSLKLIQIDIKYCKHFSRYRSDHRVMFKSFNNTVKQVIFVNAKH